MKRPELSEGYLAGVVALATFGGAFSSALVTGIFSDAGNERQTNVQLVQLAIGILSQPIGDRATTENQPQTALRSWAVDIINQSADVKFNSQAKTMLVNGEVSFSGVWSKPIPVDEHTATQEAIRRGEGEKREVTPR